jgi:topoisomerase IA-like protein
MELVRAKAEGPRTLGVDPATGQNVYVMNGRYGAYVQLGETPDAPAEEDEGAGHREAEALVASGRHDRVHGHAGRGAQAALAAARRRPAPGRQRADRHELRPVSVRT